MVPSLPAALGSAEEALLLSTSISHSAGSTCEALQLEPTAAFYVVFCSAKLYIQHRSTDVVSGGQSTYMHMSDMFSYYFGSVFSLPEITNFA